MVSASSTKGPPLQHVVSSEARRAGRTDVEGLSLLTVGQLSYNCPICSKRSYV